MDDEYFGGFSTPDTYGQSFAPNSAMANLGASYDSPEQSFAPSDFDSLSYLQNGNSWGGSSWDSSNIPMDTLWGDQSFAPGSAMSNLWQQTSPEMSMPNFQWDASFNGYGDSQEGSGGSIQQTLANIFNSKGMEYGLKGLAALMEGRQNKKYAGDVRNNVQQMQQGLDPFGSQRPFYQQQLQQTVQNPYSAPIVRDQVAQIAKAQAIKDAAAGRRSNSATSSPAMLAAQAQIAQQYMNSLMQPAGAGIGPQQVSGGLSALNQASQANTQGYASPIMNALGNTQQDQIIEAIKALAAKNSGGG